MTDQYYKIIIIFTSLLCMRFTQITEGSVVSTGDFNKDFFVTWSPNHVNTSADGRERSLQLDQESGTKKEEKNPKFSIWFKGFSFVPLVYICRSWFCFKSDVFVWRDWHANKASTRQFSWHSCGLLCKNVFSLNVLPFYIFYFELWLF